MRVVYVVLLLALTSCGYFYTAGFTPKFRLSSIANRNLQDPDATNEILKRFDKINPNTVFPGMSSFVPQGSSYSDTVPDTLDLAERARIFLHGITNSMLKSKFYSPPGSVVYGNQGARYGLAPVPQLVTFNGVANWGKSLQAMAMARKMSGYDLDNRYGTLGIQYESFKNSIDRHVNLALLNNTPLDNAWIVIPHLGDLNPMTTVLEALMEVYKTNPSDPLKQTIQAMVDWLKHVPQTDTKNGVKMAYYGVQDHVPDVWKSNKIGVMGLGANTFMHGKVTRAMSNWDLMNGDDHARELSTLIGQFMIHYNNGETWDPEFLRDKADPGTELPPRGPGHYAGHNHAYLNGLMGLLSTAEARLKKAPNDAHAQALIAFVKGGYLFTRDYRGLGVLGNFGESCALGDMLRLAVKLTELGAGDYFDDVDRWLRNSVAEMQILDSSGIADLDFPDKEPLHRIGSRVRGLFFEDATHVLAIPYDANNPTSEASESYQTVACGLGNLMMGVYDAWEHIIDIRGSYAQVNLLLNRASEHLDVKSELPYNGVVTVITKSDLRGLSSMAVRLPDWAHPSQVQVTANGSSVAWSVVNSRYVAFNKIAPNTAYRISFPMVLREMTITQIKDQSQLWTESNTASPNHGHDFRIRRFTGYFRGNTLVDVQAGARPSGGWPLYQRQALAALPLQGVTTPMRNVARFALGAANPIELPGEPPVMPSGFQGACVGNATMRLSWAPVPGAVSYLVRVNNPANDSPNCQDGWYCPGTTDARIEGTTSTVYQGYVVPNRHYSWWVIAVNKHGQASPAAGGPVAHCNSDNGYPPNEPPPPKPHRPEGLNGQCIGGGRMRLFWQPAHGATQYLVRVDDPTNNNSACQDGWYCSGTTDARIEGTASTSYEGPVVPNRLYNWWVIALNERGEASEVAAGGAAHCNSDNGSP